MHLLQARISLGIAVGVSLWLCPALLAQSVSPSSAVQSNAPFWMVDVVAVNAKTGMVLPNLSKDDFRVLDNGHDVPVISFGSGAHYTVSPIALWLVVECNNFSPPDFTSGFMRGKTQFLQPALAQLDKADAVGVAHWCGDGTQAIDLAPSPSADAALSALDTLLKKKSIESANRQEQGAKQRMVEMILASTRNTTPGHLPVMVFLYGDAGYAFVTEANDLLRKLLATPDIVYGLNNAGYHFDPSAMFGAGRIYYEIRYLSTQTGGDFYGSPVPERFAQGLDYILMQVHFRYSLGFTPVSQDGKEHDLKIELTPEGQQKYADAVLRYRTQYIPIATTTASR